MMGKKIDNVRGAARVAALLADDQPTLFAEIGELDWYAGSHRSWIDDLGVRAGDSVLEVGCATGALSAYLDGIGGRVTGLDNSDDMITRGRQDHPGLNLVVGDATSLPYDDGAFTVVVAASVINVVPDAELALSEMHRVCAPGGVLSVLVPAAGFSGGDLDNLIDTLGPTGFSKAALTKWHTGPPKMSPSQLESLLGSVGIEAVATRSYLNGMLLATTGTVLPGRW
jgi:SAM-dependent methyltransferase